MAKLGVRSFLFLALSAGAVLPVGLLGLDQAKRWEQSEVRAADRQALAAARSAADHVSRTMLGFANACESFSAHVAAVPGFQREGLEVALAAHLRPHPEFLGTYIADASGTSILSMGANGEVVESGLSYKDRSYYQELVATRRTAISRVQLGRFTKVVSVNIASPILDSSRRLLGMTCTALDLGDITKQAKNTVRGMVDGRVILVDGQGRIIADSVGRATAEPRDVSKVALFAKVASGQSALRVGSNDLQEHVRAIAVGLSAPVSDWNVIAMTPQSTVDAHARQVRNQTALFALVLIFIALGLAAWLAAWFARPLRALAATADSVTRGKIGDTLPAMAPNAPREVAQLTEAVRSMIYKLREHSNQLEGLVRSRTLELSRSNQELAGALGTIRETDRLIREDIAKARLFQERMLPALPALGGLEIAVRYAPLEQVSGDIYDAAELANGRLRLFLVDATGHGVQASMRTIVLKTAYDRLKLRGEDPTRVLARLNEQLVAEFPEGELHSEACCLDLTPRASHFDVSYTNAGNTPLFVLSASAPVREHYTGGPLLGVTLVDWPTPQQFRVARGDVLLVCSDGLIEQMNAERARFESKLADFRLEAGESAEAALSRLMTAFDDFRGERPVADDVTLIAIRALGLADLDDPLGEPA
jgi:serine phosphatase RsbU (regulator of sigma subunit)